MSLEPVRLAKTFPVTVAPDTESGKSLIHVAVPVIVALTVPPGLVWLLLRLEVKPRLK